MIHPKPRSVLIIGSGVAGLAVSKSLDDICITNVVVDRHGRSGGAYVRMYPRTRLSSPARYLSLPGAKGPSTKGPVYAEEYASHLNDYAASHGIKPLRGNVEAIRKHGPTFLVTFSDSSVAAEFSAVVVCTGMFDNPYIPDISGLANGDVVHQIGIPVSHASSWHGPTSNNGRRVLIVGGGMTAVEIAEECAEAELLPTVSTRTGSVLLWPARIFGVDQRPFVYQLERWLPLWTVRYRCNHGWMHRGMDRGFRRYLKEQRIYVRPMIQAVQGQRITFVDGTSVETDSIILATGYRFKMPFLPESLPRLPTGVPLTSRGESLSWPGLFFVGTPCAQRMGSHFVFGIAADATVVASAVARHLQAARPSRRIA